MVVNSTQVATFLNQKASLLLSTNTTTTDCKILSYFKCPTYYGQVENHWETTLVWYIYPGQTFFYQFGHFSLFQKSGIWKKIQKLQCKFKNGFFNIFCEKPLIRIHSFMTWCIGLLCWTFFCSWENLNSGICFWQKSCLTSFYRLV